MALKDGASADGLSFGQVIVNYLASLLKSGEEAAMKGRRCELRCRGFCGSEQ